MARRSATQPFPGARLNALPYGRMALALSVSLVLVTTARILFFDDPAGGRPFVVSPIIAAPVDLADTDDDPDAPATSSQSAGASAPMAVSTNTAKTPAEAVPSAPPADSDPLYEDSRFGPLPRRGADGSTVFEAYRHPTPVAAFAGPRIAVMVTGLGMDFDVALTAINALPTNVSLAFTSYAPTLEQSTGAARTTGHEVFLELPLEPFDYPSNDPGPDTLLTGQPPRDNLDRLYQVMSSTKGYVGMINAMGARFTASNADFSPVLEDLAKRGLGYVDDGSSSRSLASQIAAMRKMPFARADMTLDSMPDAAAMRVAFDKMESIARKKGGAVGLMSALPISVKLVQQWLESLPAKGITLVPVSTLMKDRDAKT